MLARVTRIQDDLVIVMIVMSYAREVVMLVSSETVVMLGMVVVGVRVNVPRRDLAHGRAEDARKKGRKQSTHDVSVSVSQCYRQMKRPPVSKCE